MRLGERGGRGGGRGDLFAVARVRHCWDRPKIGGGDRPKAPPPETHPDSGFFRGELARDARRWCAESGISFRCNCSFSKCIALGIPLKALLASIRAVAVATDFNP